MQNKKVIIAIVGKSASGKDSLAKQLVNVLKDKYDCGTIVSYTTRPQRVGEKEGIDYKFVNKETFVFLKKMNSFLETTDFNGWMYGTPLKMEHQINIGVFNPEGIESLINSNYLVVPIYLSCPLGERIKRSFKREKKFKFEYFRRAIVDSFDFIKIKKLLKNFEYFLVVDTEYHGVFKNSNRIIEQLKSWSIL